MHDAEPVAQRSREHSGPCRRADEGEPLERKPQRFRVRAAVDEEVDLEIFHGRIKIFFDDAAQPMDLVDEEDVARFERGEDAHEIFGLLERRAGRRSQGRAEFARDQARQRRLAQTRRSRKQHVFERFTAPFGRIHRDFEIVDNLRLTDIVIEGTRTQRCAVGIILACHGG
jgi:hypothetical protein